MALSICSAVLFAIAFSLINPNVWAASPQPEASKREKVTPQWYVNLHAQVGSTPLGVVAGIGRETLGKPKTSLWFVDENTIVVTYVTREPVSSVSKRGEANPSLPLRLRAIFINASDGHIQNVKLWPIESRDAGVVAIHDGVLVMQAGNRVWEYSRTSDETRTLQLPESESSGWDAHPSIDGKSILFVATNLRTTQPVAWVWLDAEQFRIKASWKEVQSGWVGISDDKIAMTTCVWTSHCAPQVQIRSLDAAWETIAPASNKNKPRPRFVNDQTLVLLGDPTRIVDTDGHLLFTDEDLKRPEGCWWAEPFAAGNGLRFAVPSCKLKGAFPALDLGGTDVLKRIILYDSPFHQIAYILDLSGPKIQDLAYMAMSPNGLQLAILKNESLELIKLPPIT
jgi:hypothetical protein